jgi:hypothetical protein
MSRTFELLNKAKQLRAEAAPVPPPAPAQPARIVPPSEDEVPFIEVGGPDELEASPDVLACPPPVRKLHLHAATPPQPKAASPEPPATISFCCWNG